jgi:hypothetical protein
LPETGFVATTLRTTPISPHSPKKSCPILQQLIILLPLSKKIQQLIYNHEKKGDGIAAAML